MDVYYKHSGKIGPLGLPSLLITGMVGSVVLGIVFALCDHLVSVIISVDENDSGWGRLRPILFLLRMLIPFLVSVGLGWALGKAGILSKVRNLRVTMLAAFAAAVGTMWMYWSVRTGIAGDTGDFIHGWGQIFAHMRTQTDEGGGVRNETWWVLQSLVVLLGTLGTAKNKIQECAFDESIGEWVHEKIFIKPLTPIGNPILFKKTIESGDISPLLALTKVNRRPSPEYASIELIGLENNPNFRLITVHSVKRTQLSKLDEKEESSVVLDKMISTAELNDFIRELIRQPSPK